MKFRSALSFLCMIISTQLYEPITIGITKDGVWYLYDMKSGGVDRVLNDKWTECGFISPVILDISGGFLVKNNSGEYEKLDIDVIFPVVHGKNCEDGTLQGMLSLCGIPYVGSGCTASAICMDKAVTKLILSNYEVPQANALCFYENEIKTAPEELCSRVEATLTYPVFVKPSASGSSVGAYKVRNRDELLTAIKSAAEFDRKVLVEEYIIGREVEIAALETVDCDGITHLKLSCCGEINPGAEFYDYNTKYINDTAQYYIPAHISTETEMRIKETASLIFTLLGCRGLSRIDFFVRDFKGTEEIIFNEINTLPGFTSISMYPSLFAEEGVSGRELVSALLSGAHI